MRHWEASPVAWTVEVSRVARWGAKESTGVVWGAKASTAVVWGAMASTAVAWDELRAERTAWTDSWKDCGWLPHHRRLYRHRHRRLYRHRHRHRRHALRGPLPAVHTWTRTTT